jgi:hypothetical protein
MPLKYDAEPYKVFLKGATETQMAGKVIDRQSAITVWRTFGPAVSAVLDHQPGLKE